MLKEILYKAIDGFGWNDPRKLRSDSGEHYVTQRNSNAGFRYVTFDDKFYTIIANRQSVNDLFEPFDVLELY